jgi:hypothetical protein
MTPTDATNTVSLETGPMEMDLRVLREQLGGRRLRLNDDQHRRLASKANGSGGSGYD